MSEPDAPVPTAGPPAAWYPDPHDASQLRYWDGTIWTEHRAPAYQQAGPTITAASVGTGIDNAANSITSFADRVIKRVANDLSSQPTVQQILGRCLLEAPRQPLSNEVVAVGETYFVTGIRQLFVNHSMTITTDGVTLEHLTCALVATPWNQQDPTAVAVCVGGLQVGNLPADQAAQYAARLIALGQQNLLASGEVTLWAKADGALTLAKVTVQLPPVTAFG